MTQTYPAQHLPQTGFPSPGPDLLPTTTSTAPTGVLAPASRVKLAGAYLTDAVCVAAVAGLVWLLFPSLVITGIVVLQMAVVFSLLRARTGRTPGALLTRTAAVTEGTSRAPGLKRQLVRSMLMTLLHITALGPLISILLGRDGQDWMDRICGTASADLRKPAITAEQTHAQSAFSPYGDFAAAQAFTPSHDTAVPSPSLTNPASPFPQSAPAANPVAPPTTTQLPWTGAPQAQGPWDLPSAPQSIPPVDNGYNAAAPLTSWGQPSPQTPAAAPPVPWGQPSPQAPATTPPVPWGQPAPQAFQSQPSAPQPPAWHSTAAPQAAPPQELVGGGSAGTGGTATTGTPPPSTPGRAAVDHDEALEARHNAAQNHPVPATSGPAAPSTVEEATPLPKAHQLSSPRRAAAQAPDITQTRSVRSPQHSAASPASAANDEPMAWLVVDSGQREKIDAVLVIGREPSNAAAGERLVALPDPTRSLSRTHMRVGVTDTGPWVEDAFSTNGVTIRTTENIVTRLESSKRTPVPFGTTLILGERTMKIVDA